MRQIVISTMALLAFGAAAQAEDFLGKWAGSGEGEVSASIRPGRAKPDILVIALETATQGCAGSVTVYGRPEGDRIAAESYMPDDPDVPLCRIDIEQVGDGTLRVEEVENCLYFHGAACGFTADLSPE
jgi:hypothetical protein